MPSTTFYNARLCISGSVHPGSFIVDNSTGLITSVHVDGAPCRTSSEVLTDLEGAIVAPGLLELQTNGLLGFHFTHFEDEAKYQKELERVAKFFVTKGVTGFWATIPTVSKEDFRKILPFLAPQSFEGGATLLGAHVEGPYLAASRKGAHDASLFHDPDSMSPEDLYGADNLRNSVKMVTLAPELPGSSELISQLTHKHKKIVSLGHSAADYDCGVRAVEAGASTMTHVFNAMNPLHHRSPGLAGLMPSGRVYYSVIPDGIHLHPATLTLAFLANREKCILITDSIEMAGLPDGVYPGHSQIPSRQRKEGNKVTIDGTDTLIGSCTTLDECARNLVKFSDCGLSEAVRCVTENIANLMGEADRGMLETGRRGDFIVLSEEGDVLQTWIGGKVVFDHLAVDSVDNM